MSGAATTIGNTVGMGRLAEDEKPVVPRALASPYFIDEVEEGCSISHLAHCKE